MSIYPCSLGGDWSISDKWNSRNHPAAISSSSVYTQSHKSIWGLDEMVISCQFVGGFLYWWGFYHACKRLWLVVCKAGNLGFPAKFQGVLKSNKIHWVSWIKGVHKPAIAQVCEAMGCSQHDHLAGQPAVTCKPWKARLAEQQWSGLQLTFPPCKPKILQSWTSHCRNTPWDCTLYHPCKAFYYVL